MRRRATALRLQRYVILLATLMVAAPQAEGYVRTLTSRGNPIAWHETCVFLVPPLETPAHLPPAEVLEAIRASAQTWSDVPESYLRFVLEPAAAGKVPEFRERGNNENVVVFVESGWEHDRAAAAITTITYIASSSASEDGRILDTDVELNTEDYPYSTSLAEDKHDLQNILTHELGHVLGLDHTCDDGTVEPTPLDHLGNEIPSCYPIRNVPPEISATTMFNFAEIGETDKRTLEPDDMAGIAAIYPLARDPGVCAPPDLSLRKPCGCGAAEGGGGGGHRHALPWLLVSLWLTWRLGRSRRAAGA